jgi:hypothetical protein
LLSFCEVVPLSLRESSLQEQKYGFSVDTVALEKTKYNIYKHEKHSREPSTPSEGTSNGTSQSNWLKNIGLFVN